jgi:hypothetical protein
MIHLCELPTKNESSVDQVDRSLKYLDEQREILKNKTFENKQIISALELLI